MSEIETAEIALVGARNVGKTTLFNALTNSNNGVGNWQGVTICKSAGVFQAAPGKDYQIIDLPGVDRFHINPDLSEDQQEVVQYLLAQKPEYIINVLDINNLRNDMFLTLQLLEYGAPMFIVVNTFGKEITSQQTSCLQEIEKTLNVRVLHFNAQDRKEAANAVRNIQKFAGKPVYDPLDTLPNTIAQKLAKLEAMLPIGATSYNKWAALLTVESECLPNLNIPENKHNIIQLKLEQLSSEVEQETGESAAVWLLTQRHHIIDRVMQNLEVKNINLTTKILDSILLNKYIGLPIFLIVMYYIFFLTMNLGTLLQGHLEDFYDIYVIESVGYLLADNTPDFLRFFITEGMLEAIKLVISFTPLLFIFYSCMIVLQESGYINRLSYTLDPVVQRFGISGESIPALLLGFGCNVPAILATKSVSGRRERILTTMLIPFLSCSARLSIYIFFGNLFFPGREYFVFAIYLIGIAVALLTSGIMKHYLKQESYQFNCYQLSNYIMPNSAFIFKSAGRKTKDFCMDVGKIIIQFYIGFYILIHGLEYLYPQDIPLLHSIAQGIAFLFTPIGITTENWPAVVAIFTGFIAKEFVIAALGAIYGNMSVDYLQYFRGEIGIFCYLLFISLYFPCISVFATIVKQLNIRWAIFSAVWATSWAYFVASAVLLCSNLLQDTALSYNIIVVSLIAAATMLYLKYLRKLDDCVRN